MSDSDDSIQSNSYESEEYLPTKAAPGYESEEYVPTKATPKKRKSTSKAAGGGSSSTKSGLTITDPNAGDDSEEDLSTKAAPKKRKSTPKAGGGSSSSTKKPKLITKKALNEKLKYASEKELKGLVLGLLEVAPEALDTTITAFHPAKMPRVVRADDPVLKMCFNCQSSEELQRFDDVRICEYCHNELYARDRITRDKVMDFFNLTAAEAKKLPCQRGTHGMFRSPIYLYNVSTCIKAAKTKYGSLYNMVRED